MKGVIFFSLYEKNIPIVIKYLKIIHLHLMLMAQRISSRNSCPPHISPNLSRTDQVISLLGTGNAVKYTWAPTKITKDHQGTDKGAK